MSSFSNKLHGALINPLYKGILEFRRRVGFDPESLFRNGDVGVYYDPSDLSTLFQDYTGTTPVTAAGQPVGLMLDKSGNGNHASQATAGKRPILQESGGLYSLKFDGVDDCMSTAAIDMTGTDKVSCWAGITRLNGSASLAIETSTNFNSGNGTLALISGSDGATVNGLTSKSRGSVNTTLGAYTSNLALATNYAIYTTGDIAGDLSTLYINGVKGTDGTQDKGTGNLGNYPLHIASRAGTGLFFNGNLYPLIIAGALYDANTVAKMNAWTAKKTGVVL